MYLEILRLKIYFENYVKSKWDKQKEMEEVFHLYYQFIMGD